MAHHREYLIQSDSRHSPSNGTHQSLLVTNVQTDFFNANSKKRVISAVGGWVVLMYSMSLKTLYKGPRSQGQDCARSAEKRDVQFNRENPQSSHTWCYQSRSQQQREVKSIYFRESY